MRRSRPKDPEGKFLSSVRRDSRPLPSPPSSPVEPADIDWGLLSSTHSCCVCGEAHVPTLEEGSSNGGSSSNNNNQHMIDASSRAPPRRRGGPGGGADESFVVLPDSTPVLSESYFSLSRNPGVASGSITNATTTRIAHEINYAAGGPTRVGSRQPISSVGNGSSLAVTGSSIPGSELLDSGYGTGHGTGHRYGYGSGFGGWTGSGFGVGSSMLESIVQISHAGLSDNVRRESLLCELSKRPARALGVGNGAIEQGGRGFSSSERNGGGGVPGVIPGVPPAGGREEEAGTGSSDDHPTLCCHCYASLLEQIDEDSRVADRETLAYRDFAELLDSIADDNSGLDSDSDTSSTSLTTPVASSNKNASSTGIPAATTVSGDAAQPKRRGAAAAAAAAGDKGSHDDGGLTLSGSGAARETAGPAKPAETAEQAEHLEPSPFAQALQMAERTSVQLRTELSSLEAQRGALCARGSEAWAALSELAYARGVLGNECRELLQVSREVAEKAAHLSERSALSDLFSIRHMDGFPSINGYRLGKYPDDKRHLQWNEINAAWGELARGPQSPGRRRPDSAPVAFAHDLFSTGGGGGRGGDKPRFLAAVGAFLACSTEAIACVERRVLERRLEGEMSAGAACVAWSDVGMPYKQTEDAVGGVAIASLKSQASWKAWLCQLVKNLEWAVTAASSLCVA
ncbi:unnamed protein product [Laminaria digitata]